MAFWACQGPSWAFCTGLLGAESGEEHPVIEAPGQEPTRLVEGDPAPPRAETLRAAQVVEIEPGRQGGLLDDVLGGGRVGQRPATMTR